MSWRDARVGIGETPLRQEQERLSRVASNAELSQRQVALNFFTQME